MKLTREQVRTVECPVCRAGRNTHCTTTAGKPRVSCHVERWNVKRVAIMLNKPKAPLRAANLTPEAAKKKTFKIRRAQAKKPKERIGEQINNHGRFANAKDEIF